MSAIAGLAKGFMQGVRLRSDLDDAEERRGLMKLQKEQARLQLDEGNEKKLARTEAADLIKGYQSGDDKYGFVKNEDGSYDPNNAANLNRYYDLSEKSAMRVAVAHGQDPYKAANEVRNFRKSGFQEGVNMAAGLYSIGDFAGGDAALKRVYPLVRDGQTFLGSQPVEGDPSKVNMRYRVDGTGEERSYVADRDTLAKRLLPLAMNITDAANYNLSKERFDLERKQGEDLKAYRDASLALQQGDLDIKSRNAESESRKTDALIQYYGRMGQAALARATQDDKTINLQRETQALNNQLFQVTTLLGIKKDFNPSMASKQDIQAHDAKLATANRAQFLIANNIEKGKLGVDATRALQLVNAADSAPFSDISKVATDTYVANVNGFKVPISLTDDKYQALAKLNQPKK